MKYNYFLKRSAALLLTLFLVAQPISLIYAARGDGDSGKEEYSGNVVVIEVPSAGVRSVNDLTSSDYKISITAAATASFTKHDFVRIVLKGRVDVEAFVRANTLRENLEARFFYLEVFNDCRLELDEEAYANDISLKSEMIRMVLGDDSLSESEKSRIIQCGWNALRGKELPE